MRNNGHLRGKRNLLKKSKAVKTSPSVCIVSIFKTSKQEKLFAEVANRRMSKNTRLSW